MSSLRSHLLAATCLGALVGAAVGVARVPADAALAEAWGVVSWLDTPLLALLGALGGLGVGLLVPCLGRAARRSASALAVGTAGVLVVAFAVSGWTVSRTRVLPEQPAAAGAPGGERPDIVVIIYDAVRADLLAADDGLPPAWAPNLRRLAERGVTFTAARSPAPWTLPSHASLFTGLSPLSHGAIEETPVLRDELITLAERFAKAGYTTIGLCANPWLSRERGFAQGFDAWIELWRHRGRVPLLFPMVHPAERLGVIETGDPRLDKGARLATRLAERVIARQPADRPLFLFINLVDAHPPYAAPGEDRLRLVPREVLEAGIDPLRVSQDWRAILAGEVDLGVLERRALRGLVAGEIAYMDRHLGRIAAALEHRGRFDGAAFVVTSDHGAALGERRRLGSGFDLSEEMLRIPLIAHWPHGRDAGRRRDDPVYLHDLAPTLLELAGLPAPMPPGDLAVTREGRPLDAQPPRTAGLSAYARPLGILESMWRRYPRFDASFLDRRLIAVHDGRYKLVWSSRDGEQLRDTAGGGDRVLTGGPSGPAAHLHEILTVQAGGDPALAWERALEAMRATAPDALTTHEETRDMLRSLGYLGSD